MLFIVVIKSCYCLLQVLKAGDLESMSCVKLTESSALHKSTDSVSCIEIIEENIPDDNDKLQSKRFKNTELKLQTRSFKGMYVHDIPTEHNKN